VGGHFINLAGRWGRCGSVRQSIVFKVVLTANILAFVGAGDVIRAVGET
jgi:hypothetical protein